MGENDLQSNGASPLMVGEYISDDIFLLLEVRNTLNDRLRTYKKVADINYRFRFTPGDYKHTLRVYVKTYGGQASVEGLQGLVS